MAERVNEVSKGLTKLPTLVDAGVVKTMNVANNSIVSIDSLIKFSQLETLSLHKNSVKEWPDINLGLTSLDISANPLTSITSIFSMTTLQDINISQCNLKAISDGVSTLVGLTNFVCIANKLNHLCKGISACTNLRSLDLSNNLFTVMPSELSSLVNLTYINVDNNAITKGFTFMSRLTNLLELHASWNEITKLSNAFYALTSLTSATIHHNRITCLHKQVSALKNLRYLDMSSNPSFSLVSREINTLPSLEKLNLSWCPLLGSTTFPSLSADTKLASLSISHCGFEQPPIVGDSCFVTMDNNKISSIECIPKAVSELKVDNNDITSISFFEGCSLKKVNLCNNKLTSLCLDGLNALVLNISFNRLGALPRITHMTKLRQLYCSNCGLTQLPVNLLDNFPNLETFECSMNHIDSITFGPMPSLQTFVMQFCGLSIFPISLLNCPKLRRVDLSSNELTKVSTKKKAFSSLEQLKELDLSHNSLKDIGAVTEVVSLQELNISYNPIKNMVKLIEQLGKMTDLRTLYADGIKLERVPKLAHSKLDVLLQNNKSGYVQTVFKRRGVKKAAEMAIQNLPLLKEISHNSVGVFECCGRRPTMQDALVALLNPYGTETAVLGLFDGHGGENTATHTSTAFLEWMKNQNLAAMRLGDFQVCIEKFVSSMKEHNRRMHWTDGTTGVMAVVLRGRCLVANIGDSRCVIIKSKKQVTHDISASLNSPSPTRRRRLSSLECSSVSVEAVYTGPVFDCNKCEMEVRQVTVDHKPSNDTERQRIRMTGNYISDQEKVNGLIAVSRSIGDVQWEGFLSSTADIYEIPTTPDDSHIVLACDGVWDVLSNEDVGRIVASNRHMPCSVISKIIVNMAYLRGTGDNISCVVYSLHSSGSCHLN